MDKKIDAQLVVVVEGDVVRIWTMPSYSPVQVYDRRDTEGVNEAIAYMEDWCATREWYEDTKDGLYAVLSIKKLAPMKGLTG